MDDLKKSGRYVYSLNGEAMDIKEEWSIESGPSGEQLCQSRRQAPGIEIAVSSAGNETRVERFEVEMISQKSSARFTVWSSFEWTERGLVVRRKVNEAPVEVDTQAIEKSSARPLLSPLMRIYAGPLIANILDSGGCADVVVPFIADPEDTGRLLQAVTSERRARLLGSEPFEIEGCEVVARCCEYVGDQYAPGTRFWLGPDNRLLRYSWLQTGTGEWDVRLQY